MKFYTSYSLVTNFETKFYTSYSLVMIYQTLHRLHFQSFNSLSYVSVAQITKCHFHFSLFQIVGGSTSKARWNRAFSLSLLPFTFFFFFRSNVDVEGDDGGEWLSCRVAGIV